MIVAKVIPRHPCRGIRRQLPCMPLKFGEIVERIGALEFAGVDQTHEQVAHLCAIQRAIEECILAMQHHALQRAFA